VARELAEAGLEAGGVVLASSGQAVSLHVPGHDTTRVARIARFVQSRDWGGVLFSAAAHPGDPHGAIDGTFALEFIQVGSGERSPDLLVTFPWTSQANAFGVPGGDLACVSGAGRAVRERSRQHEPVECSQHTSRLGPDLKQGRHGQRARGQRGRAPTILAALGLDDRDGMDGRVLTEALAGGPDPGKWPLTPARIPCAPARMAARSRSQRRRPSLRRQELARRLIGGAPLWESSPT
jgi:hypothetical protein